MIVDLRLETKTVHVFMEGGVIQDIQMPEGVQVKVYDYDIEDVDPDQIKKDGNGDECTIAVWTKEG